MIDPQILLAPTTLFMFCYLLRCVRSIGLVGADDSVYVLLFIEMCEVDSYSIPSESS